MAPPSGKFMVLRSFPWMFEAPVLVLDSLGACPLHRKKLLYSQFFRVPYSIEFNRHIYHVWSTSVLHMGLPTSAAS